ncbi:hypothetical protein LCGC14_0294710 [marine sediment metagenome]|uniref:Uncharacterized protein n=1 Tax=marine sediment metagenome TaxID=412755 RepID=A0A0F9WXU1_9ZZZZ
MATLLGTNIEVTVKDKKLVLTIDTSEEHGRSTSGKSTIVATTRGNLQVPGVDGLTIGLNAYRRS